jgi:hypothetical protein
MSIKDKRILEFARQQKGSGRLNTDDLIAAEKEFKKLSPGERKARFVEMDDYQDMVANRLKAGMGELFGTAPKILQRSIRKMPPPPTQGRRSNTKPVLDSKGNIVKNLRQKAKQGGQFQEVDVIDLTTEMVIDE